MKFIYVFALILFFQNSVSNAMDLALQAPKTKSFVSCNKDMLCKVALSAAIFSGVYALVDYSSGLCTKQSLWQACKDGLLTAGALAGALYVCQEPPLTTQDFICTTSIGLSPLLMLHTLLLKHGIGV